MVTLDAQKKPSTLWNGKFNQRELIILQKLEHSTAKGIRSALNNSQLAPYIASTSAHVALNSQKFVSSEMIAFKENQYHKLQLLICSREEGNISM
jgi:hypothetical protein